MDLLELHCLFSVMISNELSVKIAILRSRHHPVMRALTPQTAEIFNYVFYYFSDFCYPPAVKNWV